MRNFRVVSSSSLHHVRSLILNLVRSLGPSLKNTIAIIALLALTGCATRVKVTGPYATALSNTDVEQIKIVYTYRNTHYQQMTIDAISRDHVEVMTLKMESPIETTTMVGAVRHGQTWRYHKRSALPREESSVADRKQQRSNQAMQRTPTGRSPKISHE
jgi:hypothetical protein